MTGVAVRQMMHHAGGWPTAAETSWPNAVAEDERSHTIGFHIEPEHRMTTIILRNPSGRLFVGYGSDTCCW